MRGCHDNEWSVKMPIVSPSFSFFQLRHVFTGSYIHVSSTYTSPHDKNNMMVYVKLLFHDSIWSEGFWKKRFWGEGFGFLKNILASLPLQVQRSITSTDSDAIIIFPRSWNNPCGFLLPTGCLKPKQCQTCAVHHTSSLQSQVRGRLGKKKHCTVTSLFESLSPAINTVVQRDVALCCVGSSQWPDHSGVSQVSGTVSALQHSLDRWKQEHQVNNKIKIFSWHTSRIEYCCSHLDKGDISLKELILKPKTYFHVVQVWNQLGCASIRFYHSKILQTISRKPERYQGQSFSYSLRLTKFWQVLHCKVC